MTPFCGPRLRIQRRRFGLATLKLLQKTGRSKFWGLLWEVPPSSGHGFSLRLNTIGCFLTASRPFKFAICVAPPPLLCLLSGHLPPQGLPPRVRRSFCQTARHPGVGMSGHASRSHSTPVIMGNGQSSDAHGGIGPSQCGPRCLRGTVVGLIVSTLWLNVMRTLPARWQRLTILRQLTQSTSEEQWQAVASLPRLGTTVQIGRLYLKERALVNRTLMRWIRGCPLMGGSSSQPRPRNNVTGLLSCGHVFPRPNKPSSGRNRVPCRGCPSLLFPLRPPLGSLLSSSTSSFLVASSLPSLSLLAPAGVAVHSTSLAAGVLGSRGFSLESAAARVCREAGAQVSTNLFVRDLDLPIVLWRSLRTGFRCSAEPNWPSIPR